eukprot:jgi/Botrbrau1/8424/Bobra.0237s0044.1
MALASIVERGRGLFILLGGYPPSLDENEPALFAKIRSGVFSFDDPVWDNHLGRGEKLCEGAAEGGPEAADHGQGCAGAPLVYGSPGGLRCGPVPHPRDNMRRISKSRFRGAVQSVIALQRLAQLSKSVHEGKQDSRRLISDPKDLEEATAAVRRYELRLSLDRESSLDLKRRPSSDQTPVIDGTSSHGIGGSIPTVVEGTPLTLPANFLLPRNSRRVKPEDSTGFAYRVGALQGGRG